MGFDEAVEVKLMKQIITLMESEININSLGYLACTLSLFGLLLFADTVNADTSFKLLILSLPVVVSCTIVTVWITLRKKNVAKQKILRQKIIEMERNFYGESRFEKLNSKFLEGDFKISKNHRFFISFYFLVYSYSYAKLLFGLF